MILTETNYHLWHAVFRMRVVLGHNGNLGNWNTREMGVVAKSFDEACQQLHAHKSMDSEMEIISLRRMTQFNNGCLVSDAIFGATKLFQGKIVSVAKNRCVVEATECFAPAPEGTEIIVYGR